MEARRSLCAIVRYFTLDIFGFLFFLLARVAVVHAELLTAASFSRCRRWLVAFVGCRSSRPRFVLVCGPLVSGPCVGPPMPRRSADVSRSLFFWRLQAAFQIMQFLMGFRDSP